MLRALICASARHQARPTSLDWASTHAGSKSVEPRVPGASQWGVAGP